MPEEKLNPEGELVGKVVHYFGNIRVGVIELSGTLKKGNNIRIVGKDIDFEQEVDSMEVNHDKVDEAGTGDSIGLRVEQKIREGCQVYKI